MLDTKSFRPHQVLGDAQQYNATLQRQKLLSEQSNATTSQIATLKPPMESLSSIDSASVPVDVWAAAQLLGDSKGVRLLRIYEELTNQREAAVQQITLNQSRRQQERQYSPDCSTPAGLAGAAGLALSRQRHATAAAAADHVPGQTLSRRTVMDTLKEGHDEKVLTKWATQQAAWQQQVQQLAAATGKHPADITLNRGDAWRHKVELLAALEVAVPAAAAAAHKVNKAAVAGSKDSGDNTDGSSGSKGSIADGNAYNTIAAASGNWMATLRNSNERFVQIGNVFSGLFLSLKTAPSTAARAGLTTIRTPAMQPTAPPSPPPPPPPAAAAAAAAAAARSSAHAYGSSSSGGGHSNGILLSPKLHSKRRVSSIMSTVNKSISSSQGVTIGGVKVGTADDFARRRSWSEEPYLREKLAAGATAVKALASAAPDASGLYVSGSSIESQLLSGLTVRPVGLDQVEARLAVADPALFREYQTAKQAAEAQAAAAAAAAAAKAQKEARRAAAENQGPHLTQDTDQLSMHYDIPVPYSSSSSSDATADASLPVIMGVNDSDTAAASGAVTVTNTGTAAVYYSWVCNGRLRPEAAAAAASSSHMADAAGVTDHEKAGESHGNDAGGAAGDSDQPQPAVQTGSSSSSRSSSSSSRFYMPTQKGVILPGEVVKFRFCFKASQPGIYHESWSMFCHPPLEPDGITRKQRGLPLGVTVRGAAVMKEAAAAAGSDGGMLLLARQQQELQERLAAGDREYQVQGVLRLLLDTVIQTAQQKAAAARRQQQQQYGRQHEDSEYAAAAAKWAAANPPLHSTAAAAAVDSSLGQTNAADHQQQQQHVVYYYSPSAVSRLSAIYSRTRALLQPPTPPVEPKKGAARKSETTSTMTMKQQAAAAAGEADHHAAELLPEIWDYSIQGLRATVELLLHPRPPTPPTSAGTTGAQSAAAAAAAAAAAVLATATAANWRQQHAILKQQLEAALAAASVPDRPMQITEAAARQVVLQLADAVPAAAEAAKAACDGSNSGPSTYRSTRSSTAADGVDHFSSAASSSAGSSAAAPFGAVTHRAKAAAAAAAVAAATAVHQEQYRRVLQENVWSVARQQLSSFEAVVRQHQAAVAAQLDGAAAAAAVAAATAAAENRGAVEAVGSVYSEDELLWRSFGALRKKLLLGV